MAAFKTNRNKIRTALLKTNFSWLETLSLGLKRFLHSKGPKNAICLLAESKKNQTKSNLHCLLPINFPSLQGQITFLGPLKWGNLFGPKDKVSSHEKLVFRTGVWFLFLFVLTETRICKKGHHKNFIFQQSSLLFNTFWIIYPKFVDAFCIKGLFWFLACV